MALVHANIASALPAICTPEMNTPFVGVDSVGIDFLFFLITSHRWYSNVTEMFLLPMTWSAHLLSDHVYHISQVICVFVQQNVSSERV